MGRLRRKLMGGHSGQTTVEMALYISVIVVAIIAAAYVGILPKYVEGSEKLSKNVETAVNAGNTKGEETR